MSTSRRTIVTQDLLYNDIHWKVKVPLTPEIPMDISLTGPPSGLFGYRPYWSFNGELNATNGLKLTNVAIKQIHPPSEEDIFGREEVFESIEFTDLKVFFNDGTSADFDIEAAFNNVSDFPEFEMGEDGTYGSDNLFQRGIKLTLNQNVAGVCRVQVELSVVFRAPSSDFDPGSSNIAMKIFPQIGLTWLGWQGGESKKPNSLRGAVRMVVNLQAGDPPLNRASFFTDSNTSDDDDRERASPISRLGGLLEPPHWSYLFDYTLLDVFREKEIVGVYGPISRRGLPNSELVNVKGEFYHPKFVRRRKETYTWRPGLPTKITLEKYERQGAYDNIHIHGNMGYTVAGDDAVHAPFCGQACLHLHWRWATASVDIAPSVRKQYYKGWKWYPFYPEASWNGWPPAQANTWIGSPLIPPNQHLTITLAHPDTKRRADGTVVNPNNPEILPSVRKAIWYTVDISPLAVGRKEIIFEQGCGYAFMYNNRSTCNKMKWFVYKRPADEKTCTETFHHAYDMIRYFMELTRHDPQVPEGNYRDSTGDKLPMEDL
jgi:hypothetical protein